MKHLGRRILRLAMWLAMSLVAVPVQAGLTVGPLKQEVMVKPGETATFRITVSNTRRSETDMVQSVRLEVMDVAVSEEGALAFSEGGSQKNSASGWIKLGKSELTLEPGQSEAVECTIKVPYSAAGEYYSTVMVTLNTKGQDQRGVAIGYRVASGVFVTIAGRSLPRLAKVSRGEVVWPDAPPPNAAGSEPWKPPKVVVVLQNTGQARFDAIGKVSIADAKSRRVFTATLTSRRACLFAGDSRRFEAVLDRLLPPGGYVVKVEMDYQSGWSKAFHSFPLEITPDRAELLKVARKVSVASKALPVQPVTDKVSASLMPGTFRSLKLTLMNNTAEAVGCVASLVAEGESRTDGPRVSIGPREFTVPGAGQRTLEVKVYVPVNTASGQYSYAVAVNAHLEGEDKLQTKVPLEINIEREE